MRDAKQQQCAENATSKGDFVREKSAYGAKASPLAQAYWRPRIRVGWRTGRRRENQIHVDE